MHGLMGSFTAHLAEEVPGDVKDARRAAKSRAFYPFVTACRASKWELRYQINMRLLSSSHRKPVL
jgi:hypothetical protein